MVVLCCAYQDMSSGSSAALQTPAFEHDLHALQSAKLHDLPFSGADMKKTADLTLRFLSFCTAAYINLKGAQSHGSSQSVFPMHLLMVLLCCINRLVPFAHHWQAIHLFQLDTGQHCMRD